MKYYKTKWILTANEENAVLENKAILVDDGKIIDIVDFNTLSDIEPKFVKDLGNSVITPGFINLFTQLQFTDTKTVRPKRLKNKLKRFFMGLVKNIIFAGINKKNYSRRWAYTLCNYRSFDRNEKIQSFKNGLNKSIENGITCLAQVSKEKKFFEIINKSPIKTYVFLELYADSSEKSKSTFKEIRSFIEKMNYQKSENTFLGVAPHSISFVHKKLWNILSKYCRKNSILMLTRLGESQDEIDWLKHGFSDIDLLHKFLGMRKMEPYKKDLNPVSFLEELNVLSKKVIVANGNYLSDEELKKLSDLKVKFAYMPRYNKKMCGKTQKLSTLLNYFKGHLGFGLESFIKYEDFSLLKQIKELKEDFSLMDIIKYLTIYPAKILRLDHAIGSVEINKDADFLVFNLEENEDYNSILEKQKPNFVYVKGRKIIKNEEKRYSL